MDSDWLHDKQVACTGRLACMTRDEATRLVTDHGGKFAGGVNRQTSILVVGQDGWPLRRDGRLSKNLLKAQSLQRSGHAIAILSEDEFLTKLGLDGTSGITRVYSTAELTRILKVPRDRLRAWVNAGMIQPVELRHGISYFDFRQVAAAKSLLKLTQAGVGLLRISRSLRKLQALMNAAETPLAQLALVEKNGQMAVRLDAGQLVDTTGQLLFDFEEFAPISHRAEKTPAVEDWFARASELEEAGRLTEAAEAYGQALGQDGPHAQICFNLANVLYSLGQKRQAVERYRQGLQIDNRFPEAWNNLGNVLRELGDMNGAFAALSEALRLSPLYADAHYNLADLLDQVGRRHEARGHWQAYVRQDAHSPWASHARRRLKGL